jgi:hypothetical protein
MEFLGDVGQMVAHFGPFGDRVNLDTTKCEVCVECAAWNSFWVNLMGLLRGMGQVEAHFNLFGHSVNLDAM